MQNTYPIREEEMEIDLKHLLYSLLRHWRSLVVVVLIATALGAGYYVLKTERGVKASESKKGQERIELDADSRAAVEMAVRYKDMYDRQYRYMTDSLLMKLNGNEVWQAKLQYYITEEENPERAVAEYENLINLPDFLEELAGELGVDRQYAGELVEVSDSIQQSQATEAPEKKNRIVNYIVKCETEEQAKRVLGILQKKAAEVKGEGEELLATTECVVDSDVIGEQNRNQSVINGYKTGYETLVAKFDESQKAVYNDMLGLGEITAVNTAQEAVFSSKALLKRMIIAVLIGLFLWGGYGFYPMS